MARTRIRAEDERDFLLAAEPVSFSPGSPDATYTPTYASGKISNETWRRANSSLIKTIDYTYTGNLVTGEVRKVYDEAGSTIIAQVTWTYVYTGQVVTSMTLARNV